MQTEKVCYICGAWDRGQLDEHHCIYGQGRRKISEKYGLKIYVCHTPCHMYSDKAIHSCKETDEKIKQDAQKRFTEVYPDLDFRKIFGKNYL